MGDFKAEIDSIRQVASGMTNGAINTATQLQQVLAALDTYAATSDWSQVPSCTAFGASYNAAVKAYHEVANDLLSDATKMQAALQKIAQDYSDAEDRSRAAFDARMAALGTESYLTHSTADATYRQNKGDLHSDDAEQAPHQDPQTATSGATPTPPAPARTSGGTVKMS